LADDRGRAGRLLYRDLDVVEYWVAEARQGRFEVDYVAGHVVDLPTYVLAGELAQREGHRATRWEATVRVLSALDEGRLIWCRLSPGYDRSAWQAGCAGRCAPKPVG
jgi:hypothetical protein